MSRLLLAYDGSAGARAAIAAAAGLFPGASTEVALVGSPAPAATLAEGVELAGAAGLHATAARLDPGTPWRELCARAGRERVDAIVCGAHGEGSTIGSTAAGLLHHCGRPLVVAPTGSANLDGVLLAGYDGSESARGALRFAAAQLPGRPVVVAHAWRSPVRHSVRGRAFLRSGVEMLHDYAAGVDEIFSGTASDVAEEGAAYACELGLDARPRAVESAEGDREALLWGSQAIDAAALLVGSRGRGPIAAAVLGSVTAGLLDTPPLPVIVVPEGC